MKYYSLSYSFKVWFTSVFLSPFICVIIEGLLNLNHLEQSLTPLRVYPVIIIFELIFSCLTWLAFWGITILTLHLIPNAIHRKLILFLVSIIFTIVTYLICFFDDVDMRHDSFAFEMMVSNCLCVAAGSLFFKLGPTNINFSSQQH